MATASAFLSFSGKSVLNHTEHVESHLTLTTILPNAYDYRHFVDKAARISGGSASAGGQQASDSGPRLPRPQRAASFLGALVESGNRRRPQAYCSAAPRLPLERLIPHGPSSLEQELLSGPGPPLAALGSAQPPLASLFQLFLNCCVGRPQPRVSYVTFTSRLHIFYVSSPIHISGPIVL